MTLSDTVCDNYACGGCRQPVSCGLSQGLHATPGTEIAGLIGDRVTLAGLTFTLQSYPTNDSLATTLQPYLTQDSELYLYKSQLYSNSLALKWKENGENQVLVPLLITFQALEARVSSLEAQVSSLISALNTANQIIANTAATATTAAENAIQALLLLGQ